MAQTGIYFQAALVLLGGILGISGSIIGAYFQARLAKKREAIHEVYRPLFNKLDEIVEDEELPYRIIDNKGRLSSIWYEFDAYQRLFVDDAIRSILAGVENDIEDLNQFLARTRVELSEVVGDSEIGEKNDEGKSLIIADRNQAGNPSAWVETKDWVKMFGRPLIKSSSPESLKEELIGYSLTRGDGHHRHFESWDEFYYEAIWEAKSLAEETWERGDQTNSRELYYDIIQRLEVARDRIGDEVLDVI